MKNQKPHWNKDRKTVEYDKEDFETSLPSLAKEMMAKKAPATARMPIHGVQHGEGSVVSDGLGMEGDINTESVPNKSDSVYRSKSDERRYKNTISTSPTPIVPDPGAVDFIRRCKTPEEALEIIRYLESRDEISADEAKQLTAQLQKEGLKSFGSKRIRGYYERDYHRQIQKREK